MIFAGLMFLSTIIRGAADPHAFLATANSWWKWFGTFYGFFVAPMTCWTLWNKKKQGKWWGLCFIGMFAIYFLFSAQQKLLLAGYNLLSVGPLVEIFTSFLFVAGLAYWFGFSRKSKLFFAITNVPAQMRNEP
jgi:hypothetical protein